ncbi:hypothetical protein V0288_16330 [Pannus brasiliensis CCIBt3594]|uniref:DDE transposase family protein n=1 Tax=Pannus brasiliensis CCIBt3594 TaxID=1427578 RepID=A0AAW9QZH2_9CHRO
MENDTRNWYIVKEDSGTCSIVSLEETPSSGESWGPYPSREEAIARRIGLIRSGKCRPIT